MGFIVRSALLVAVLVASGCGDSGGFNTPTNPSPGPPPVIGGPPPPPPPAPTPPLPSPGATPTSIQVRPLTATMKVGKTLQFGVWAIFPQERPNTPIPEREVTKEASWRINPPGFAIVSPTGLVTAVKATVADTNLQVVAAWGDFQSGRPVKIE